MSDHAIAKVSQKAVVFLPTGELLVLLEKGGGWEFPGGKIDAGERAGESLLREVDEETGIDVTVQEPVYAKMRRRTKDRQKYTVYYRCTTDERDVTLSGEHTAYAWITPEGARDLLNERRRTALELAIEAGKRRDG